MSKQLPVYEVDKEGLAKLLRRRGVAFAVTELLQNSFDEDVTKVDVQMSEPFRGIVTLRVEDDDPEGFVDLAHAYTLFAESEKVNNPEQRGRFNLGEKLVVAVCEDASIASTKGTVIFDKRGRTMSRRKTERGSVFEGRIKMTRNEYVETDLTLRHIIPPLDVELIVNGERIERPKPYAVFEVTLPTERADAEGYLRPTRRKTLVEVFSGYGGQLGKGHLYEMGIPVVMTDDTWTYNVMQKVPLNTDRDNVTPAYLRELRTAVTNHLHSALSQDDAAMPWVEEALADSRITDEAVRDIMEKRFGAKRVSYDPSDPEANNLAVAKGYKVIHGGTLSGAQWMQVKRADAILPAGQVTPSPKPFSEDGDPAEHVPYEELTDGMKAVDRFVRFLGPKLVDTQVGTYVLRDFNAAAAYEHSGFGSGFIVFNLKKLGRNWFKVGSTSVTALVIHELAHAKASNHLSDEYHRSLSYIGARLATLVAEDPSILDESRWTVE